MAEKANSAANTSGERMQFSHNARFFDGSPFDAAQGGLVRVTGGQLYSLARPDRVPSQGDTSAAPNPYSVERNRVTKTTIVEGVDAPITDGLEVEFVCLDRTTGQLARAAILGKDGKMAFRGAMGKSKLFTPELHGFAAEVGYPVSSSPEEAQRNYIEVTGRASDAAEQEGIILTTMEVVGQRAAGREDRNPHPYVDFVAELYTKATGSPTEEVFAVYAPQAHRRIRDTLAATKAAARLQKVQPKLVAGSLVGNFFKGRRLFSAPQQFTPQQRAHLQSVGLYEGDFAGKATSWRYALRRLGSISGGAWVKTPQLATEAQLKEAHSALATGEISAADRFFGEHTDRIRYGLGPTGTREDCSMGTYAGNPKKIVAHQLITGSVFSSTELMYMRGVEPTRIFPDLFGTLGGSQALERANRDNIAVHRFGMNAEVDGRAVHTYGKRLLDLAEYDPANQVPQWAKETFLKSFASDKVTRRALQQWCRTNNCRPTMRAYHEMEIGSPSVYMDAVYESYREQFPQVPEGEIIRMCEMDIAFSAAQQLEKERAALARGEYWH